MEGVSVSVAVAVARGLKRCFRYPLLEREHVADADDDAGADASETSGGRPKRGRPPASALASISAKRKHVEHRESLIGVIKYHGKLIDHAVKRCDKSCDENPKSSTFGILMSLEGQVQDHFSTNQIDVKNFKKSLELFWDALDTKCDPLFDNTSFQDCMSYIFALSCNTRRICQQVAWLIGQQFISSFIVLLKTLVGQCETIQRKLNAVEGKLSVGPHMESLHSTLKTSQEVVTSLEKMIQFIFERLFGRKYRDVDSDIRISFINSLGIWILSYPSLFLQDSFLRFLSLALDDEAGVRKAAVLAFQSVCEVGDNVSNLGTSVKDRMIELADDNDVSVAVSAIGILKQLSRHQLLADVKLDSLYDLLIEESPIIRHSMGALIFDHLIAKDIGSVGSIGGDNEPSEVHLRRMLQLIRGLIDDPIVINYVIDAVWDEMKAMKDWECIISMLLDETLPPKLTDVDATNLVRLLYASARKAVGKKIVPTIDCGKQYYRKTQKELKSNKQQLATAMLRIYPVLIHRYKDDQTKISHLVEIFVLLQLEPFLKSQKQNFGTILSIVVDVFFMHGEKDTLRSCVKAINYCSTESRPELLNYARNKLTYLETELISKLNSAMNLVSGEEHECSLLVVNLKRLYELQLAKPVFADGLYEDMANILKDSKKTNNEVKSFLLLNMYRHIVWYAKAIDSENSSEASMIELLSKRDTLLEWLDCLTSTLPTTLMDDDRSWNVLSSRVCFVLTELWCLFNEVKYSSARLESLGHSPDRSFISKFWTLCELQLSISDKKENWEDANEEYIEETDMVAGLIGAVKLLTTFTVPKDFLVQEIISHLVLHQQARVTVIIMDMISVLRKNTSADIPILFVESLKKAYQRHINFSANCNDDGLVKKSYNKLRNHAAYLAMSSEAAARDKHKSELFRVVQVAIPFAFLDAPNNLSFLEAAILPFALNFTALEAQEIIKMVEEETRNINIDEDPSGRQPYTTFLGHLREAQRGNCG